MALLWILSTASVVAFSQTLSTADYFGVPRLIRFRGQLRDSFGQPLSGEANVNFAIYSQPDGGVPLWEEEQKVQFSEGRYSVLLGSNSPTGMPADVFRSGESRWVGVRLLREGEQEQARVFLASVPYALKASDADTLGGLPASAFVRTQSSTDSVVSSSTEDSPDAHLNAGNQTFKGAGMFAGSPRLTGDVTETAGHHIANSYSVNGILTVDGNKYANIAAATAACRHSCTVIIPSTYAGTECPASATRTITYWDLRGRASVGPCVQNVINWNSDTATGVLSLERGIATFTGTYTGKALVSGYFQTFMTNAIVSGSTDLDGGSSEADITGTLRGTLNIAQGGEFPVIVASTGGTVTQATGAIGYVRSTYGTTPITTVYGLEGRGCQNTIGGGGVANCYGLYGDRQWNQGSRRNYAAGFNGNTLHLFDRLIGFAGLDFEDTSHAVHHVLISDSGNNTVLQATSTRGLQFKSSDGSMGASLTSRTWTFSPSINETGSQIPILTSFTTTAAVTDDVTVIGMTKWGHCFLQATNSGAAGGITSVYVSHKTVNQITVTHEATSGWTFDVMCTPK